ncbi:MAG: 2TM domain-containing protein [Methanobacteriaceae archaeon]
MNDTKYQRAKIVVEETRQFYFQIIFTIGIFTIIVLRFAFLGRSLVTMDIGSLVGENISSSNITSNMAFMNSPLFMFSYITSVFLIFLGFRYFKLYLLKRSFRNEESGIKKLKKYMKTKEIPSNEELNAKFNKDKNKQKKKFYFLVVYVIVINIILYYTSSNIFNNTLFFELILTFSVLSLFYRYLIFFHADKKVFGNDWENKQIEEYIKEYDV